MDNKQRDKQVAAVKMPPHSIEAEQSVLGGLMLATPDGASVMYPLALGAASIVSSIVGTFFVKDYLGLSAAFLAALGFWAGIPWALKMPIGHLVDLLWRYKAGLVYLGATLIAASLPLSMLLIGGEIDFQFTAGAPVAGAGVGTGGAAACC